MARTNINDTANREHFPQSYFFGGAMNHHRQLSTHATHRPSRQSLPLPFLILCLCGLFAPDNCIRFLSSVLNITHWNQLPCLCKIPLAPAGSVGSIVGRLHSFRSWLFLFICLIPNSTLSSVTICFGGCETHADRPTTIRFYMDDRLSSAPSLFVSRDLRPSRLIVQRSMRIKAFDLRDLTTTSQK